ncbi:hypothetical protein DPMN_159236 [Dreissena polymorpha]|uniref:G-protein coupled receptors family 1 profile domain-containing protein n=1 Tax=Dreissena polymorpha TaxID=45954 RepID=A0A9D4EL71_DREPO|nr:hypothetical protein DPMN_159236 [Dreissena polymorpha]
MMHDLYVHRANSFTIKMTMMIVICMAYFLLASTPFCMFFIVKSYLDPGYEETNNYVALARSDLIWTVCYLIGLTNYCANFFLYTAMNDRFSKEFRAMIRCQPSLRQVSIYTTGQSTKIRRTESTHLRRMAEEASPGIESSLSEYPP